MELKIDDIAEFTTNYLSDRSSVNTSDLFTLISPIVENQLRVALKGADYSSGTLSPDKIEELKSSIRENVNSRLHGICCVQVTSITDSNQDFERFRSVERQLYNSDKELDFMHRTGEFLNRMEVEANAQQLSSARNAEDLRHALQGINKDQLLHDDELAEFVGMLESQRRIREAKSAEEEFEAMESLRGYRLVKQDEIEQLEAELQQKKIPRDEIIQIMRIHSQQKIDMESLLAENALSDSRIDHDWEREDLERRRSWGIEDEENENRWMREQKEYDLAANCRKQEDDYDFEKMQQQSSSAQMEAMMKMAGMIKDTAGSVSGSFQSMQQQMMDELQDARQQSEERLERTQSQAMDNLAKVSTAAADNINAFNGGSAPHSAPQATPVMESVQIVECQCYNCGHAIRIPQGAPACPDCGAPFQW